MFTKRFHIKVRLASPTGARGGLCVTHTVDVDVSDDSSHEYAEMEAVAASLGGTLANYEEIKE